MITDNLIFINFLVYFIILTAGLLHGRVSVIKIIIIII